MTGPAYDVAAANGRRYLLTDEPAGWQPTGQVTALAAIAAGFLLVGLIFGEVAVLVFALPPLLVLAAGHRAPEVRLDAALTLSHLECYEGDDVTVTVDLAATGDLDQVVMQLARSAGLEALDSPAVTIDLVAGENARLAVRLRATRWGRQLVGPVTLDARSPHLLHRLETKQLPPLPLRVLPAPERFAAEGHLPQTARLIGAHVARRRGDGAEFDGLRDYQPGDRVRRVNWRASTRAGQLMVNVGRPEHSADVVVLLDNVSNVAGGAPDTPSSLDVAVRAALGVVEHYLALGDRVGVLALPGWSRGVPPRSGRRQLDLLQDWLLAVRLDEGALPAGAAARPPLTIPPGALLVLITPMAHEAVERQVVQLARRGHTLVVIDTLPADSLPVPTRPEQALAQRIWLLEREAVLARLAEIGCPSVRWHGAGSLDLALRDLGRMALRPRLVSR